MPEPANTAHDEDRPGEDPADGEDIRGGDPEGSTSQTAAPPSSTDAGAPDLSQEPDRLREEAERLQQAALSRQAAAAELREEAAALREEAAALREQTPALLEEAAALREETRAARSQGDEPDEPDGATDADSAPRGLFRKRRRT